MAHERIRSQMAGSVDPGTANDRNSTTIKPIGALVPAVEKLRKRGFKIDVVFWDHASNELKNVASSFVSLNKHLQHLALKK
jgi:nitrate/nitrite-specific signal transduction histidine kinase